MLETKMKPIFKPFISERDFFNFYHKARNEYEEQLGWIKCYKVFQSLLLGETSVSLVYKNFYYKNKLFKKINFSN